MLYSHGAERNQCSTGSILKRLQAASQTAGLASLSRPVSFRPYQNRKLRGGSQEIADLPGGHGDRTGLFSSGRVRRRRHGAPRICAPRRQGERRLASVALHPRQRRKCPVRAELSIYSDAPRGRKYCVPFTGSCRRRRSCCRSALRSTKSISEVLMTRRSDAE
jgi:hypothetical protein